MTDHTREAYRQVLVRYAGKWRGLEQYQPGVMADADVKAHTRSEGRSFFDGEMISVDYQQFIADKLQYSGHAVYRYDPVEQHIALHWFDHRDIAPMIFIGTLIDGELVFRGDRHGRAIRTHVRFDENRMTSITDVRDERGEWQAALQGQYEKCSALPGEFLWRDLTINDAEKLRDFYSSVIGWQAQACDMGGYQDYSMLTREGDCVAGVCHHRGVNEGIPPQWMQYVQVADLEESMAATTRLGGHLIYGPKPLAGQRFVVIRDPAGAVMALCGT